MKNDSIPILGLKVERNGVEYTEIELIANGSLRVIESCIINSTENQTQIKRCAILFEEIKVIDLININITSDMQFERTFTRLNDTELNESTLESEYSIKFKGINSSIFDLDVFDTWNTSFTLNGNQIINFSYLTESEKELIHEDKIYHATRSVIFPEMTGAEFLQYDEEMYLILEGFIMAQVGFDSNLTMDHNLTIVSMEEIESTLDIIKWKVEYSAEKLNMTDWLTCYKDGTLLVSREITWINSSTAMNLSIFDLEVAPHLYNITEGDGTVFLEGYGSGIGVSNITNGELVNPMSYTDVKGVIYNYSSCVGSNFANQTIDNDNNTYWQPDLTSDDNPCLQIDLEDYYLFEKVQMNITDGTEPFYVSCVLSDEDDGYIDGFYEVFDNNNTVDIDLDFIVGRYMTIYTNASKVYEIYPKLLDNGIEVQVSWSPEQYDVINCSARFFVGKEYNFLNTNVNFPFTSELDDFEKFETISLDGNYLGNYTWYDDEIGTDPDGWTLSEPSGSDISIVAEVDGHEKVVEIDDNGGFPGMYQSAGTMDIPVGSDCVLEFWYRCTSTAIKDFRIFEKTGGTMMYWWMDAEWNNYHDETSDDLYYENGTLATCDVDTWWRVKLVFFENYYNHYVAIDNGEYLLLEDSGEDPNLSYHTGDGTFNTLDHLMVNGYFYVNNEEIYIDSIDNSEGEYYYDNRINDLKTVQNYSSQWGIGNIAQNDYDEIHEGLQSGLFDTESSLFEPLINQYLLLSENNHLSAAVKGEGSQDVQVGTEFDNSNVTLSVNSTEGEYVSKLVDVESCHEIFLQLPVNNSMLTTMNLTVNENHSMEITVPFNSSSIIRQSIPVDWILFGQVNNFTMEGDFELYLYDGTKTDDTQFSNGTFIKDLLIDITCTNYTVYGFEFEVYNETMQHNGTIRVVNLPTFIDSEGINETVQHVTGQDWTHWNLDLQDIIYFQLNNLTSPIYWNNLSFFVNDSSFECNASMDLFKIRDVAEILSLATLARPVQKKDDAVMTFLDSEIFNETFVSTLDEDDWVAYESFEDVNGGFHNNVSMNVSSVASLDSGKLQVAPMDRHQSNRFRGIDEDSGLTGWDTVTDAGNTVTRLDSYEGRTDVLELDWNSGSNYRPQIKNYLTATGNSTTTTNDIYVIEFWALFTNANSDWRFYVYTPSNILFMLYWCNNGKMSVYKQESGGWTYDGEWETTTRPTDEWIHYEITFSINASSTNYFRIDRNGENLGATNDLHNPVKEGYSQRVFDHINSAPGEMYVDAYDENTDYEGQEDLYYLQRNYHPGNVGIKLNRSISRNDGPIEIKVNLGGTNGVSTYSSIIISNAEDKNPERSENALKIRGPSSSSQKFKMYKWYGGLDDDGWDECFESTSTYGPSVTTTILLENNLINMYVDGTVIASQLLPVTLGNNITISLQYDWSQESQGTEALFDYLEIKQINTRYYLRDFICSATEPLYYGGEVMSEELTVGGSPVTWEHPENEFFYGYDLAKLSQIYGNYFTFQDGFYPVVHRGLAVRDKLDVGTLDGDIILSNAIGGYGDFLDELTSVSVGGNDGYRKYYVSQIYVNETGYYDYTLWTPSGASNKTMDDKYDSRAQVFVDGVNYSVDYQFDNTRFSINQDYMKNYTKQIYLEAGIHQIAIRLTELPDELKDIPVPAGFEGDTDNFRDNYFTFSLEKSTPIKIQTFLPQHGRFIYYMYDTEYTNPFGFGYYENVLTSRLQAEYSKPQTAALSGRNTVVAGVEATKHYMLQDIFTAVKDDSDSIRYATPLATTSAIGNILFTSDLLPDVLAQELQDEGEANEVNTIPWDNSVMESYLDAGGNVYFGGDRPFSKINYKTGKIGNPSDYLLGVEKILDVDADSFFVASGARENYFIAPFDQENDFEFEYTSGPIDQYDALTYEHETSETEPIDAPYGQWRGRRWGYGDWQAYYVNYDNDGTLQIYSDWTGSNIVTRDAPIVLPGKVTGIKFEENALLSAPNIYKLHYYYLSLLNFYRYDGQSNTTLYDEFLGWYHNDGSRINTAFVNGVLNSLNNRIDYAVNQQMDCMASPFDTDPIQIDTDYDKDDQLFKAILDFMHIWYVWDLYYGWIPASTPDPAYLRYLDVTLEQELAFSWEEGVPIEFMMEAGYYGMLEGLKLPDTTGLDGNEVFVNITDVTIDYHPQPLYAGDMEFENIIGDETQLNFTGKDVWLDGRHCYKVSLTPKASNASVNIPYAANKSKLNKNNMDTELWKYVIPLQLRIESVYETGEYVPTEVGNRFLPEGLLDDSFEPIHAVNVAAMSFYEKRTCIDYYKHGSSDYSGTTVPCLLQSNQGFGGYVGYGLSNIITESHLNNSYLLSYLVQDTLIFELNARQKYDLENSIQNIQRKVLGYDIVEWDPSLYWGMSYSTMHTTMDLPMSIDGYTAPLGENDPKRNPLLNHDMSKYILGEPLPTNHLSYSGMQGDYTFKASLENSLEPHGVLNSYPGEALEYHQSLWGWLPTPGIQNFLTFKGFHEDLFNPIFWKLNETEFNAVADGAYKTDRGTDDKFYQLWLDDTSDPKEGYWAGNGNPSLYEIYASVWQAAMTEYMWAMRFWEEIMGLGFNMYEGNAMVDIINGFQEAAINQITLDLCNYYEKIEGFDASDISEIKYGFAYLMPIITRKNIRTDCNDRIAGKWGADWYEKSYGKENGMYNASLYPDWQNEYIFDYLRQGMMTEFEYELKHGQLQEGAYDAYLQGFADDPAYENYTEWTNWNDDLLFRTPTQEDITWEVSDFAGYLSRYPVMHLTDLQFDLVMSEFELWGLNPENSEGCDKFKIELQLMDWKGNTVNLTDEVYYYDMTDGIEHFTFEDFENIEIYNSHTLYSSQNISSATGQQLPYIMVKVFGRDSEGEYKLLDYMHEAIPLEENKEYSQKLDDIWKNLEISQKNSAGSIQSLIGAITQIVVGAAMLVGAAVATGLSAGALAGLCTMGYDQLIFGIQGCINFVSIRNTGNYGPDITHITFWKNVNNVIGGAIMGIGGYIASGGNQVIDWATAYQTFDYNNMFSGMKRNEAKFLGGLVAGTIDMVKMGMMFGFNPMKAGSGGLDDAASYADEMASLTDDLGRISDISRFLKARSNYFEALSRAANPKLTRVLQFIKDNIIQSLKGFAQDFGAIQGGLMFDDMILLGGRLTTKALGGIKTKLGHSYSFTGMVGKVTDRISNIQNAIGSLQKFVTAITIVGCQFMRYYDYGLIGVSGYDTMRQLYDSECGAGEPAMAGFAMLNNFLVEPFF